MSNLTGAIGGGSLPEQIQFTGASTVAGTAPARTTVPVLSPAAQTVTFNTGGIQRKGANVAMARFMVGVLNAAGNYTVKVQHSNDDGVTDAYADLPAATQGAGMAVATAAGAVGALANTDVNLNTDLRGAKLWIRYVYTLISGTGATLAQAVVLGGYQTLPASDY